MDIKGIEINDGDIVYFKTNVDEHCGFVCGRVGKKSIELGVDKKQVTFKIKDIENIKVLKKG